MLYLPFLKPKIYKENFGYTLIELLVVISIIAIMVGGGIAAYIRYNDRQIVLNTVKELQSFLRSAQAKAQVRETPEVCRDSNNPLQGYLVSQVALNILTMQASCGSIDSLTEVSPPRDILQIPSSVEVSMNGDGVNIRYLVLFGGATFSDNPSIQSRTILVSGAIFSYQFDVNYLGEISDGQWN